ncbi:ATP-dependent DNA helicase PIF1-like protein [Tanacetum coccineum]
MDDLTIDIHGMETNRFLPWCGSTENCTNTEFELKGQFLMELRENTFSGVEHEDENGHVEKFLKISDVFHVPNVIQDQVMLRVSPKTLTGQAKIWMKNVDTTLRINFTLQKYGDKIKTKPIHSSFIHKYEMEFEIQILGYPFTQDDWHIKVRIIKLWKLPSYKNPMETFRIELILLDEEGNKIQATVKNTCVKNHEKSLGQDMCLYISEFGVTDNDAKDTFVYVINYGLHDTDLIGDITSCGKIETQEEKGGKLKRFIRIEMQDTMGNKLQNVTLWGAYADQLDEYMGDRSALGHVVLIIQFAKHKIYRGGMLALKVGAPVMLLRNIDQSAGLCNGTRLRITKLGERCIEAEIITGTKVGEKVILTRMKLSPSDKRIPFKINRRQFPISVCFAMTINKSQGQSLSNVDQVSRVCANKKGIERGLQVGTTWRAVYVTELLTKKTIQIRVLDKSGSVSLTLFDRVASKLLNRTAEEFIREMRKQLPSNSKQPLSSFLSPPTMGKLKGALFGPEESSSFGYQESNETPPLKRSVEVIDVEDISDLSSNKKQLGRDKKGKVVVELKNLNFAILLE